MLILLTKFYRMVIDRTEDAVSSPKIAVILKGVFLWNVFLKSNEKKIKNGNVRPRIQDGMAVLSLKVCLKRRMIDVERNPYDRLCNEF